MFIISYLRASKALLIGSSNHLTPCPLSFQPDRFKFCCCACRWRSFTQRFELLWPIWIRWIPNPMATSFTIPTRMPRATVPLLPSPLSWKTVRSRKGSVWTSNAPLKVSSLLYFWYKIDMWYKTFFTAPKISKPILPINLTPIQYPFGGCFYL